MTSRFSQNFVYAVCALLAIALGVLFFLGRFEKYDKLPPGIVGKWRHVESYKTVQFEPLQFNFHGDRHNIIKVLGRINSKRPEGHYKLEMESGLEVQIALSSRGTIDIFLIEEIGDLESSVELGRFYKVED